MWMDVKKACSCPVLATCCKEERGVEGEEGEEDGGDRKRSRWGSRSKVSVCLLIINVNTKHLN